MQPVRLRLKIEGRPTQPRQDEAQGRVRAAKADEHRVPRPLGKDAQQVKSQPQSQNQLMRLIITMTDCLQRHFHHAQGGASASSDCRTGEPTATAASRAASRDGGGAATAFGASAASDSGLTVGGGRAATSAASAATDRSHPIT